MRESLYHKFLRVSLLVVGITLLFDGGFVVPITKELSDNTLLYLANSQTSVLATVPPNEFNVITAELTRRERELDAREASLNEREISARDFGSDTEDYSTYMLSVILFILTILILLNYFMDYARVRKTTYAEIV